MSSTSGQRPKSRRCSGTSWVSTKQSVSSTQRSCQMECEGTHQGSYSNKDTAPQILFLLGICHHPALLPHLHSIFVHAVRLQLYFRQKSTYQHEYITLQQQYGHHSIGLATLTQTKYSGSKNCPNVWPFFKYLFITQC